MLEVSRHGWAGVDHDQRGQAHCTRPDAMGSVFKLCALNKPDHAALQRGDSFRRRPRRYLRLSAVDPKTAGREKPAAPNAVAIVPVLVTQARRVIASIMAPGSAWPLPAISCALPCATDENKI